MMIRKDNRGFGLESNVHLPHITHQMASYNQTELANKVILQAKKIIKQLRQNEQTYKEQIKSLQIENETLKN